MTWQATAVSSQVAGTEAILIFNNFGLLRKSGGNGTSSFNRVLDFDNLDGAIEVDTGTLSLASSGSSSNGTFIVASGAVLDLTGGSDPTWAG